MIRIVLNFLRILFTLPSIIFGAFLLFLWWFFKFPFWWAWRYKRAQRFKERAMRMERLKEITEKRLQE